MLSSFELVTPKTLDEAITALAECSGTGALLAGGTDVLVQIRTGAMKPECLVDLKGIEELKGIKYTREGRSGDRRAGHASRTGDVAADDGEVPDHPRWG